MKIPDTLLPAYARYAAFRPRADVERLEAAIAAGAVNPMDEKKQLAQEVVARYHGAEAAAVAREFFERTVQRKEIPTEDVPEMNAGDCKRVTDMLVRAGFAASKREAERLIAGGGVKIDGEAVSDQKQAWNATAPAVLSVGSRRFVRVIP
jgi:tyrosyl-tRNA synthetase